MKKILILLVFVLFSGLITAQPEFVRQVHRNFYQKNHTAYADMWAWGQGVKLDGTKFVWIASTNTDALMQFTCSELLSKGEVAAIISHKDFLKRNYEAYNVAKERKSCIATSNDWSFVQNQETANFINKPYGEFKPNKKGIVGYYVRVLLKTGAFKSLEIQGYL